MFFCKHGYTSSILLYCSYASNDTLYNAFKRSTANEPGPQFCKLSSAFSSAMLDREAASMSAAIDGCSGSTELAVTAPNYPPAPVIFANNEDPLDNLNIRPFCTITSSFPVNIIVVLTCF